MAVGLSTAAAGALLTTLKGSYTYVQLHIADPGPSGTSQAAVETDRVQATWPTTVSTASMANTGPLTWTGVAGTEDYTHFSVWSAATGGTFGFSGTVTANPVTTGDSFTIATSGLTVSLPTAA